MKCYFCRIPLNMIIISRAVPRISTRICRNINKITTKCSVYCLFVTGLKYKLFELGTSRIMSLKIINMELKYVTTQMLNIKLNHIILLNRGG